MSSEVAASVPVQTAPAKSVRPQASQADTGFGALVDSNTTAATNAQPQDPAPRRTGGAAQAADRGPRDSSASDQPAPSRQTEATDASAPASDSAKAPGKTKGKSESKSESKSDAAGAKAKADDAKADGSAAADGLTAAVPSADQSQIDATQVAPDPAALVVAVAVPVAPADTGAATGQAASDSPLTIAAAGLAASATIAAQIATPAQIKTETSGAAADAAARPADAAAVTADQDAALLATSGGKPADPQANTGLTAAVAQATPKTSFKAAVTAQPNTDASDLTGTPDTAKPDAAANATFNPAQTPQANPATHPQTAKPAVETGAETSKAAASDRSATVQTTPSAHDHAAAAQAPAGSVDASTQAASALQVPLTTTTSTAGASTATLTVTAATTSAPVPLSGLPVEIAASARSGKTRFEISLDPVELGRIDVRISVDRNGQVTSHLTVERPETLSMLRQDAPQLQRALDDAGLKTGDGGLSFSLRDQSSSGQNGNGSDTGGNARRLIISDDETLPAAAVAGRGYGRMLGSSSGVDIRV
ncbi:flagellar hook-length control protein FliK [Bradyrhizobium sp.]|uniref:flagellar hook-length control protein FliK n=1 Tax=Bradyrhizobium sp. TaxID=376 RepID=UPI00344D857F